MTSRADWIAKSEAMLKGKAFDADTALQGRRDGPRVTRATPGPWKIFMQVDHPDLAQAEAQARADLKGGADGLVLIRPELVSILDALPLHTFALRNDAGDDGAEAMRRRVDKQPIDPARLSIDFNTTDAAFALGCLRAGFAGPVMRVDGRAGHSNGLDDAQELGAALAVALYTFRKLEALGDAEIARAVSVTLVATQNPLNTIAKFRAMRLLWAALLKACKLPDAPLALHAETSRLMFADVDAHTNILRAAAGVMAAGMGGADSISALPHSQQQGLPTDFARRVARNMHHVLLDEGNLAHVDDPAAGAGALERKTQALCEAAWAVMQRAEAGDWPTGLRDEAKVMPTIGVTKYHPATLLPPDIVVAP